MPGAKDAGEFRNGQRVRIREGTIKRLNKRTKAWRAEYIRPERDHQKFRAGEGRYLGDSTNMQIAAVKVWDLENANPDWGWVHCSMLEDDPELDDEDIDSLVFGVSSSESESQDDAPEPAAAAAAAEEEAAAAPSPRRSARRSAKPRTVVPPREEPAKRRKVDDTPRSSGGAAAAAESSSSEEEEDYQVEENRKRKRAPTRKWAGDASEEPDSEEDEDDPERAPPKKKGKAAAASGGITAAAAPRKKHKGAGADSGNSAAPEYTWTAPDGKAQPKNSNMFASIATLNGEAVRNHSWPHYRQLPDGTYRKCSRALPSHLGVVV